MAEYLIGRNAVRECLRARRRHIHGLQLAQNVKPSLLIEEIIKEAEGLGITVKRTHKQRLDALGHGHQGVALEVGRLPMVDPEALLSHAKNMAQLPFLLALDHLEDPQNVGALLRTAEAVGVHGVILPARRSVAITPAVVKASAGAAEHLHTAIVPNLVRALESLKKSNVWIVGVEKDETAQMYYEADLNMPIALVLGSEGKGLTRLVKQTCDMLLRVPMQGQVASLNVSVAGALALYEAWRARHT